MTVNKNDFYNWQKPTKADRLRFRKASPNLVSLKSYVMTRWGGVNLGLGANARPIRGGDAPSSHSFGAAWDWRYRGRKRGLEVIDWLIANSQELGIQAIHDYLDSRVWRSARPSGSPKHGWKKHPKGGHWGASWASYLHIETTKSQWGNSTPIPNRLGQGGPSPASEPNG